MKTIHHLIAVSLLGIFMIGASIYSGSTFIRINPVSKTLQKDIFFHSVDTTKVLGKKVFENSCYSCHKDTLINLAPGPAILSLMTPQAIVASLTSGKMRLQGNSLTKTEKEAVAYFLTNRKTKPFSFPKDAFVPFAIKNKRVSVFEHSGWGNDPEGTGFRSYKESGINKENVKSLKLKWAFAFPDATIIRSKPAVVDDWLLTGDQFGNLFAIHQQSGKIGWIFQASAAIRGGIVISREGSSITAYFADHSTNVFAIDVLTGKMIWQQRVGFDAQSSVTGTVTVYDGKVFVPLSSMEVASAANGRYDCCTSSGGVVALSAKTGKQVWKYRILGKASVSGTKKNGKPFYGPSGAPVWCSPTIDKKRGFLYIGTGENYSKPATNTSDAIQALDIKTGKLIWNFQATDGDIYNLACPVLINCPERSGPDLDFGMAPILTKGKDGKDMLVAGQKSGKVFAINPDDGKVIWKTTIGKGGALGGIHWGMATDGEDVFATNSDNPIGMDKRDTSQKEMPGVFALDIQSGQVKWYQPSPGPMEKRNAFMANSAAPCITPGLVFAGGLDGFIRAYDANDGSILWEFNTSQTFETTTGFPGKGGSIDGPAPVLSNGMLFVNSGYGMFGQKPGNLLLAFEVDGSK